MPKAVADLEEKAEAEPFAAEPMRREPEVVSRHRLTLCPTHRMRLGMIGMSMRTSPR